MKIAYLECFSGISGDMFLGVLVDAGVPLVTLQQAVDTLQLDVTLSLSKVDRSGVNSSKVDVLVDGRPADHSHEHAHSDEHKHEDEHQHQHGHPHNHSHEPHRPHGHGRSLSTIRQMIQQSALSEPVRDLVIRAFELLGASEARVHNVPVESIHFHEVGAVDAIADIVATSAGCIALGVDEWICSPLNVGGGTVDCAHGTFPVPAPATLDLLRGAPIYSSGPAKELVTPTGAALVRALNAEFGDFPAMTVHATGSGAGSGNFHNHPNVLRLSIGERAEVAADSICVIETAIDDSSPQILAYVADLLIAAGASDVIRTAIQMKKGRTGTLLTVLCSPQKRVELQKILFRETTTIGLHYRDDRKVALARSLVTVATEWGTVRIKIATLSDGTVANAAPEFEDCKRLAQENNIPLKQVMQAALLAYEMNQRAVR
jgi:hypothetical protein